MIDHDVCDLRWPGCLYMVKLAHHGITNEAFVMGAALDFFTGRTFRQGASVCHRYANYDLANLGRLHATAS